MLSIHKEHEQNNRTSNKEAFVLKSMSVHVLKFFFSVENILKHTLNVMEISKASLHNKLSYISPGIGI